MRHNYILIIVILLVLSLITLSVGIIYKKQLMNFMKPKSGAPHATAKSVDINACSNKKACQTDPSCQCYCSFKCGFRYKEFGTDDPQYIENDPAGYSCYCIPWDVNHYQKCETKSGQESETPATPEPNQTTPK